MAASTAGVKAAAAIPAQALRTSAVSKGYSFASTWEQNAPLSEEQLQVISQLAHATAERPLPAHVTEAEAEVAEPTAEAAASAAAAAAGGAAAGSGAGGTDGVLHNTHQFYKWFSDLESAMKFEMEEKYRSYVDTLTGHVQTCDDILAEVDETLTLFDDLQEQHTAVSTKTQTLHDACERLVQEKERLVEFADALRTKLNYFDELEKVAAQFHSQSLTVSSGHFLPLLKRLDECIAYVGSNPQYADSAVYLIKFRQLQSRALGMVRSHVLSQLRHASQQVLVGIRESAATSDGSSHAGENRPVVGEGAETGLLYVRFKAAAPELKSLMAEMETRSSRPEYHQLLSDCHSLYCEQRLALVAGVVQQRISDYATTQNLPTLTRSGCAYLMQVCQLEHQLFDHFFPSSAADPSNLAPLIDPLCTVLYDTLRPQLILEADLDLLCELVDILKTEVLEEQLGRRGEAVAGLKPTADRILADVQERLTFRAQTYMKEEITNYVPTADDLDYPAKLEKAAAATEAADQQQEAGADEAAEYRRDAYPGWFPPLEKTLSCLSKLYRCVDTRIFIGLAQEAVTTCSGSIQRASKIIARKATELDGLLFLIKHLLILREQIAPFDIDFAVTTKELDFSHLVGHLRLVFRGQASLFATGSGNPIVRMLSTGPRVLENQFDAKKELEKGLKATCEELIMSVTKLTVEPLMSFITKVTAVSSASKGSGSEVALREQAFAQPAKLAQIIAKADESVSKDLVDVVAKMRLYLHNSSTRNILFRPISSNIIEAYAQVAQVVSSDYTAEDATMFQLRSTQELQQQLEALIADSNPSGASVAH